MKLKFWQCCHPKRTRPWSRIRQTVDRCTGEVHKLADSGTYETCLACGRELEVKSFTGPLDIKDRTEETGVFRCAEDAL